MYRSTFYFSLKTAIVILFFIPLSISAQDAIKFSLDGEEKLILTKNNIGDLLLLMPNSEPSDNLFLGQNSGISIETNGYYNTGIGNYALRSNTTGRSNTALGRSTMIFNSTGSFNTALGTQSLFNNKMGSNNTAIGYNSLFNNTTGSDNVSFGYQALQFNKAKSRNTAIGFQAMMNADSSSVASDGFNTALGYNALQGNIPPSENTGTNNTAIGDDALRLNTNGSYNTSLGKSALDSNSTGWFNIGIGSFSGYLNQGGSNNLSIGHSALETNENGGSNVALGHEAGKATTGSGNIFLGYNAGKTATGSDKLFIHNEDASPDNSLIYGEFNNKLLKINGRTDVKDASTDNATITGVKIYSPGTNIDLAGVYGQNIVDDFYGVGVWGRGGYTGVLGDATSQGGSGSYRGVLGFSKTSNTGTNVGVYGQAEKGQTNYGVYGLADSTQTSPTNNYAIYGSANGVSNQNYAVYANGNMHYTGTLNGVSDKKFKSNIAALTTVIPKIMLLKPSTYTMKADKFRGMNFPMGKQAGFIAQELQQIFPTLVSKNVHQGQGDRTRKEKGTTTEYLGVNYIGMIPILTKGIQEQQETIERQSATIETLTERIEKLEKMVEALLEE